MNQLFKKTSSFWVRYSEYEFKTGRDNIEYIRPAPKAKPDVYNPLKDAEALVIDAVNVGMLLMRRAEDAEIKAAVMAFVTKYGLLGLMTALPTTPRFLDYDAAYLPRNHFIKEESMASMKYAHLFFPFDKPDITKTREGSGFSVSGDPDMLAIAMTFSNIPTALHISYLRNYAERYDWLAMSFKDWAYTFVSSFLFYEDYESMSEAGRNFHRRAMEAFDGIAPTYRIRLLDKPTIVWDFHSLFMCTQMMFSLMLTDDAKPLRPCRHCHNAFVSGNPKAAFCSPRCKNQHNVYKNRAAKKQTDGVD